MKRPNPKLLAAIGLIVVLAGIAYIPAMRGGFIWDDDKYVTTNMVLRDSAGLLTAPVWLPER